MHIVRATATVLTAALLVLSLPATAQKEPQEPADRSGLSVADLQERLGSDPAALAGFVQREIALEPYAGILRGAEGTLRAGAGNLHDRAALLAELLASAGLEARIVSADAGDAVRGLLQSLVRPGESVDVLTAAEPVQSLLADATQALIWIGDALFESGFRPAGDLHESALAAAFGRYVWVEVRDDSGPWQTLETVPAALAGQLPDPAAASEPSRKGLAHTVTLTLTAVLGDDGTQREETLLSHTVEAGWLLLPGGFFHTLDEDGVRAQLVLGQESLVSDPLPVPADLAEETGAGLFGTTGRLESVTDLLGGLPGGSGASEESPEEPPEEPGERLVRETLTLAFSGPGYRHTVDYVLFDVTDDAAESSAGDYRARLRLGLGAIHGLTFFTGDVPLETVAALAAELEMPETAAAAAELLNLYNLAYLQLRQALPTSLVGAPLIRVHDAPNLIISRIRELDADGRISTDVDLTHRRYRIVPGGGYVAEGQDLFYEAVFNGVLDQIVERAVFAGEGADWGASSLLEAAAAEDIALATLSGPDAPPPAYLAGPVFDTRLQPALTDGRILVLADALPRDWATADPAWWEVDPASGLTVDVNARGLHTANTEYAIQLHQRATWAERVKVLGCTIAVVAGSTTVQIGEALSIVDPASGQTATVIGSGIEALGELACRQGVGVPSAPFRGVAGRTAGRGFQPIHRTFLNKPWRPNGPRFPTPG